MDKDLTNLKKWLENLGFETDGKIDEEALKKLIPPQRRDMWRNIIKHVLPKEEVELIRKSILLHKLQTRQKPLPAKVESEKDLPITLKYEELLMKYNKIQKEIADTKIKNNKMKADLIKKNEYKAELIKDIAFKQNKSYLAEHKIESYNKHSAALNDLSNICEHFSTNTREDLTKTDYEDSLIECFTQVDNAKQLGTMNDSVNIGKQLCNAIFKTISDKSPTTLIQTVEENMLNHMSECDEIIGESKDSVVEHIKDDKDILFNELSTNLCQKQLELKSKLSHSITEKECQIKKLIETAHMVKNEIISQYKLKNVTCTDHDLLEFKKNLQEAVQIVIKNRLDSSDLIGLQDNFNLEEETFEMLNNIHEKTNYLNEEINQKKIILCEMLKELNDKKNDFGLMEVNSVMNKLAENYSNNISDFHQIFKQITSLKHAASCDVDKINKLTAKLATNSSLNFQTLQDITQSCEMVNVIGEITNDFEQLNQIIKSAENNFDTITQKENAHKTEFNTIFSQMESNISKLNHNTEDCKHIANVLLTGQLKNVLAED